MWKLRTQNHFLINRKSLLDSSFFGRNNKFYFKNSLCDRGMLFLSLKWFYILLGRLCKPSLLLNFYSGKVRGIDAFLKMRYNFCYINGRIMINTKPLCYEISTYSSPPKGFPLGYTCFTYLSTCCPKRQSGNIYK